MFLSFLTKLYSIHTNLKGFYYNSDEKRRIIQNLGKLSPFFKNIHDSFFTAIYIYNLTIERLKGCKHADVKFAFALHVRA